MITDHSIAERLRSEGLKATPRRLAVAGLLLARCGLVTPEDVWKRLRPKMGALGLPTVYRILEDLERVGLAVRVDSADTGRRYAACRAEAGRHHHHLVCVRCGAIGVITACSFERDIRRVERSTGFRIASHRLEAEGLCSACRRSVK
jgi:Fur family transcriptional regulator, ferric uptake regulator